MKISVDDKELFTLSDIQKNVIMNDIHEDIFDEDMKRRIQYIIMHKYEQCLKRLKDDWMPILQTRLSSIPTSDEELSKLIMSQKDYKSRKDREVNEV